MVGLAMSVLDTAIVNVALPVIAKDMHADAADAIWVVNAYQLAVLVVAAAVRLVRRHFRISPGLPLRPRPLYGGHIHQRDRGLAGDADPRPRPAGARRRRADERQHRAGPLHLSAPSARARDRHGVAGRLGVGGLGPEHRRRRSWPSRPWPWLFAVNVPIGIVTFILAMRLLPYTKPSEHRFDVLERGAVRADVHVPDRRHHRGRARPVGAAAGRRIRRRDADRLSAGPTPAQPADAAAAGRSVPAADLRAVGHDVGVQLYRAGHRVRVAAVLFPRRARRLGRHDRADDDAVGRDDGDHGADRRPPRRPLSGRHSRRHRPVDPGRRLRAAGAAAGRSGDDGRAVARRGLRLRVRLLPVAEQPRDRRPAPRASAAAAPARSRAPRVCSGNRSARRWWRWCSALPAARTAPPARSWWRPVSPASACWRASAACRTRCAARAASRRLPCATAAARAGGVPTA